ncbi:hypothetical protein [Paratissierella segnis]|uniref:hypothetical protein n=1 Tax=Paratissierella segnis TaxID=2763679 RepID=UPI00223C3171|nr:hypothetical protein [Paratissierella segnis]
MSEEYRFFDSIDGEDERFYTADEFAEYFRQFIRNGIFNGGENLKVVTDEKDMKISIKPGYAWIEGYLYKIAGEDLILEHGIADPSLNRIDRVVIRLDKTLENRYVKAFILEGTPESTPKAPSLTRNDNIYEISLAQVEIIAGKSFIESYQITDERLDNTVCGITTHLFEQVDTTDIFNEWEKYLIHKRNESDASYEEFVTAYQNIWNSWIEDKISEPSGEFYAEWKYWFNEVQDTTNLVTKSQFDEHKIKVTTEFEQGHMSIEDKQKLDKIEENANNYIHPTTAGNLHIPVGGLVGQILKNIGNGKAGWADNIKAVYGTYTGNNGFNRVIALGFKPKFIFITNIKIDNSTTLFISVSVDKGGFMMNSSGSSFFYNNNTFVPVAVDNGFSISGNSGGRLNYNINRYEYFAIG